MSLFLIHQPTSTYRRAHIERIMTAESAQNVEEAAPEPVQEAEIKYTEAITSFADPTKRVTFKTGPDMTFACPEASSYAESSTRATFTLVSLLFVLAVIT